VTSARALDDPAAVATSLTCAVWHISLDDIVGVSPLRLKKNEQLFEYSGVFSYTSAPPGVTRIDQQFGQLPEVRKRDQTWWVTSSIKTDFDLHSLPGCRAEGVQQAIWDAAQIAVDEDFESRDAVCAWFDSQRISACRKGRHVFSSIHRLRSQGAVAGSSGAVECID
jgi:hypothetical protein